MYNIPDVAASPKPIAVRVPLSERKPFLEYLEENGWHWQSGPQLTAEDALNRLRGYSDIVCIGMADNSHITYSPDWWYARNGYIVLDAEDLHTNATEVDFNDLDAMLAAPEGE